MNSHIMFYKQQAIVARNLQGIKYKYGEVYPELYLPMGKNKNNKQTKQNNNPRTEQTE